MVGAICFNLFFLDGGEDVGVFVPASIEFAAEFTTPGLNFLIMQMRRGSSLFVRIRVQQNVQYGSDLHIWRHGGYVRSGNDWVFIDRVWTGSSDPWAACEYWGPLENSASSTSKFCGNCGVEREAGSRFCGQCGSEFPIDGGTGVADQIMAAIRNPPLIASALIPLVESLALESSSLNPEQRNQISNKLQELLASARPGRFIDGTIRSSPGASLTLSSAQYIAEKVARNTEVSPTDASHLKLLLEEAPLTFGYWGPFKYVLKNISPSHVPESFGKALGRLSHGHRTSETSSNIEDLSLLSEIFKLPSAATRNYMERRMRRDLAELAISQPDLYPKIAAAMLIEWDATVESNSFLPGYVLRGGTRYLGAASRQVKWNGLFNQLETGVRRCEAHPDLWDQNVPTARHILESITNSVETFTFAARIILDSGEDIELSSAVSVKLAIQSHDDAVAQLAFAALVQHEEAWESLPESAWIAFFSRARIADIQSVTLGLQARTRIPSVAGATHSLLLSPWIHNVSSFTELGIHACVASLYLAYSMPINDYRTWPNSAEADRVSIAILALAYGFDKSPDTWASNISIVRESVILQALCEVISDPRLNQGTFDVMADSICRTIDDYTRLSLAQTCLLAQSPRIQELGWRLITSCDSLPAAMRVIWEWLPSAELSTEARLAFASRLLTLSDSQVAAELVKGLLTNSRWQLGHGQLSLLLQQSPQSGEILWSALGSSETPLIRDLLTSDGALLRAAGDSVRSEDLKSLTHDQQFILLTYLKAHQSRILEDREFAIAAATTPVFDLQTEAIAQIEATGQLPYCWLSLAESSLPLALDAAGRYFDSLRDPNSLTEQVLAAIDSQVPVVRDMGFRVFDARRTELEELSIWTALLESDDPVVQARVAEEALAGALMNSDALNSFDRRILITRRGDRRTKERVKDRVMERIRASSASELVLLIETQRLAALKEMAQGANARDREWALQRLANLALAGVPIQNVEYSRTSEGRI